MPFLQPLPSKQCLLLQKLFLMKKWLIYIGFFTVLVLCFFFFLFRGTDNWQKKSPIISYVQPFKFTTQDGKPFTNADMKGKVCVVEYFFTTCKGICPMMNGNMRKVYEQFKDDPNFMVVAHTCDPDNDSVPRLRRYADSMKIDTKKWVLLYGRKDSLYRQARNSYLLDDPKNNFEKLEDQFLHTQFFAVVDKNGQVRGQVYDGLKQKELDKLQQAVAKLLAEKAGPTGFVNGIFNNNPN